jgi:predicted 3-demethylubiquinone-9 3-methyltransferase (glyoxalase superfamily)
MQKISPFLWFDTQAQEAAEFYVSLFDDSKVTSVSHYPDGKTLGVSFVLNGLEYQAMNAGPQFPFTEAISLFVRAETQEEIDDLWEKLTADGGEPGNCGWLKDRFGLSWQVVPPVLDELLSDPDADKAGRAMQAMLAMHKIDIAALRAAFDGV